MPAKSEAKSTTVAADNTPAPQVEAKIAADSGDTSKNVQTQSATAESQLNAEITPEKGNPRNVPNDQVPTENNTVVKAVAVPIKKDVTTPQSDADISRPDEKKTETPIEGETNNIIDQYAFGNEIKDQIAPSTNEQVASAQNPETTPMTLKGESTAPKDGSPKSAPSIRLWNIELSTEKVNRLVSAG